MAYLTSYEGSNNDYENGGTGVYRAQSFQVQNGATITGCSFWGSKGSLSSGTFKFILVSTLGGSELATTGSINSSTLTAHGSPDWNAVTFTTPYDVAANTTYYIVLVSLTGSATDEVRWSLDNTSPTYSYGTRWGSNNNITWTEYNTTDYSFRISGSYKVASQMISYWKLDESSGNAADSVGSNTGTNVGTTTFSTGKVNNGSVHNGSSQYFTLPTIGSNTNFSINLWAKGSADPAGDEALIATNDCLVMFSGANFYVQAWVDRNGTAGTNKAYTSSSDVNDLTQWHMYTVTAAGSTYKKYIDGLEVGTFSIDSPGNSFAASRIGNARRTSGTPAETYFFNGTLDEVGYWSRAITADEIRTLYNSDRANQYNFTTPVCKLLQLEKDNSNLSTYTFSSQNFGNESDNRCIICGISARTNDGTSSGSVITSVTIGGVAATIANQVQSSGNTVGIAAAVVPTGTTGDVVVVFNETMTNADIALYYAENIGATSTDSGTSTSNVGTYDLDINANGFAVALMKNDTGTHTATWAGLSETYDEADSTGNDISGSAKWFSATQTNLTVSCTWSGTPTRPVYVTASFPYLTSTGSTNFFLVL